MSDKRNEEGKSSIEILRSASVSYNIDNQQFFINHELADKNSSQKKIMIVEDEEATGIFYKYLLKKYKNVEIILATNGVEALDIYHSQPDIDLIILNYGMPKMNGLDFLRVFRASNRTTPIIANSANPCKEIVLKFQNAGANDFFCLPPRDEILLDKILKFVVLIDSDEEQII